jgi:hypothetical protein
MQFSQFTALSLTMPGTWIDMPGASPAPFANPSICMHFDLPTLSRCKAYPRPCPHIVPSLNYCYRTLPAITSWSYLWRQWNPKTLTPTRGKDHPLVLMR